MREINGPYMAEWAERNRATVLQAVRNAPGIVSYNEIVKVLGLGHSAVNSHLVELEKAGLVEHRDRGWYADSQLLITDWDEVLAEMEEDDDERQDCYQESSY